MSLLYVYALVDRPVPPAVAPSDLVSIEIAGLWAAAALVEVAPMFSEESLRHHDTVVRGLDRVCEAVLPARFGQIASSTAALAGMLAPRAAALGETLAAVRGCVQMTLRFFGKGDLEPDGDSAATQAPERVGPGTSYLLAKRRVCRPALPAIVAAVQERAARLVRRERLVSRARPPLLATLYHLVSKSELEMYERLLAAGPSADGAVHLGVSGPWPAYAFAEEALR